MKFKVIAVLISAVALTSIWGGHAAEQQKQNKVRAEIMQKKLKNAQKLLEGLALADFGKMTGSAEELLQLSTTEEWMVMKTPKYELFNNEFQRATEDLISKSKRKNVEGATLAYFDMTMCCVRCHSYVREVRGGEPEEQPTRSARSPR